MRILFSLIDFREIGGAQMYFYELARALNKKGHKCTIISNTDGFMASLGQFSGINCIPYKNLNDLSIHDYDIIHASHIPNLEDIVKNDILPGKPLIATCHSEIIPLEYPYNHHRIAAYIAIRPTIKDLMLKEKISEDKIHLIYNPIDVERYNINYSTNSELKQFVFVGSIDHLRKKALEYCYEKFVVGEGYKMLVVGRNDFWELPGKMKGVNFLGQRINPEEFIKSSSFVVGIQNGRTKWEAALCGKPYLDIQVDDHGNILTIDDKPQFQPDEEVIKYRSDFVADRIEELYSKFLNK
jgi:glycosyltransferase involved in cell wall biosynthesis